MAAIRREGKINENTTLIDIGLFGIAGGCAIYLIEGKKKCVIDGGTRSEASRIYKTLKGMNAFPPDIIILTHSHYDHTQAVPYLCKKAAKEKSSIEIMASQRAIPLLKDQSFNKVFNPKEHFENIEDVTPLNEGDIVDLGGITLKIFDVPGHMKDHIAILDEKNKNIFVGDSIGVKPGDNLFIPPFQPPYWNKDAFYDSVNKLREIDFDSLCLAHFGYIYGDEAKGILDEAVLVYEQWWQLFEKNIDKLDDTGYMMKLISKEADLVYPEFRLLSFKLKVLSGLMTGWKKLIRKKPESIGELLIQQIIAWLAQGFKTYKNL